MVFTHFLLTSLIIFIIFQTFLIGFTMDSIRSIEKIIKEYINKEDF